MKPNDLKLARLARGLSQTQASTRLGLSQPYLAMLESGKRPLTRKLARQMMQVYGLRPTVLPPGDQAEAPPRADASRFLAESLSTLGYRGFRHLRSKRWKKNPAEVLLAALVQEELDPRVVEALPWLLFSYWDLDRTWLVRQAKLHDVQNRLGFLTSLAHKLAEKLAPQDRQRVTALEELEAALGRSRLAHEDLFFRPALPHRERQWLEANRPDEARYWNVLTDWKLEHLPYSNEPAVAVG